MQSAHTPYELAKHRFILVQAGISSKMTDTSFFPNMIGIFFSKH